jgi:hypothetical protein
LVPEATHKASQTQDRCWSMSSEAVRLSNRRPVGEPNRGSFPFGAPACRIYRPSRSVMQASSAEARSWVLEFEPHGSR